MSAHTPGPWSHSEIDGVRVPIYSADRTRVAEAVCIPLDRKGREPEIEANARLIAAAPDLLAACLGEALTGSDLLLLVMAADVTLDEVNKMRPLAKRLDDANAARRAAIAKAVGK